MNLDVSTQVIGDALVISVKGDLDAHGAIALDRMIEQALADKTFKIMVNCIQLDYISSAGMGVFISYIQDIKDRGGSLVFFGLQSRVRTAFELLGLQKVFAVVETEAEARQAL
jgi:anti-sigma B factor antagonist